MIADVWAASALTLPDPSARSGGHDKNGDRQRVPPLQHADWGTMEAGNHETSVAVLTKEL